MSSANKRTPHEHMLITVAMMEKKKQDKQQADKEATSYTVNNVYRIKKRLNHLKHH